MIKFKDWLNEVRTGLWTPIKTDAEHEGEIEYGHETPNHPQHRTDQTSFNQWTAQLGKDAEIPEGAIELDETTKPEIGQTVVVYHGGPVDVDVTKEYTWFALVPTSPRLQTALVQAEDYTGASAIHRAVITITENTLVKNAREGIKNVWHIQVGKGDVVIPLAVKSESEQPEFTKSLGD